jgi:fructosamine-3-kinase
MTALFDRVETALGRRPDGQRTLAGGCVGEVWRLDFADGQSLVAKTGGAEARLDIEGAMLVRLNDISALPLPGVHLSERDLLLMDYLPGGDALNSASECHAADLLAGLHGISRSDFGLDFDTLIGGLHQPNPGQTSWRDFFRDQRLIYMADLALQAGRLPTEVRHRIDRLAERLAQWIGDTSVPGLIHGDLWGGNVLASGGRISGLIDPAIYYADAEIELAFSTLFKTFGERFFDRYREHRPIAPGFFEERRDLYNLYPLLVHVRLFGGGYVGSVERSLTRFGV